MSHPRSSSAVSADFLKEIFPFHFAIDRNDRLCALGASLKKILPELTLDEPVGDLLKLEHAGEVGIDFEVFATFESRLVIVRDDKREVKLRGQVWIPPERDRVFFLGSPWLKHPQELLELKLDFSDFALHDPIADFLHVSQSQAAALNDVNALVLRMKERREELRALNAALAQSEKKYRGVVDNLKEVVFQTDEQGRWTFLNRAWEETTGFSIEASLG